MPMSEDLHDIDHLFRDGIEGHEADVPPSVWQAVSNDLDKKQASYYKSKYYRLKRAAVLLLLLCFLGGVYLLYNRVGEKKNSPRKDSSETVSSTNSSTERKDEQPSKPNRKLGDDASTEIKEGSNKNQPSLSNDTVSILSPSSTATTTTEKKSNPVERNSTGAGQPTANDNATNSGVHNPAAASLATAVKKQREGLKNAKTSQSLITSRSSTSIVKNTERTKKVISIARGIISAQKETGKNQPLVYNHYSSPSTSSPQPTDVLSKILPLNSWQYNSQAINLKALPANNKTFLPQTENAATAKNKTGTTHSFSLFAFAAPNLAFDRLEDDDHLAGPGRNREEAHKQEQHDFSFSAGLLFSYGLTKNISLQSGISITSSSTSIAPSTIYAKSDGNGRPRFELHCSSGFAYITPKSGAVIAVGDSAKTSGTVSKLTYVTIPALVSFHINKSKFSFSPTVGAGLNFLTSGKTTTSLTNTPSDESATTPITGLKPSYVDGQLGLGIEYGLSKKLSIGIRPNARLALTPINQETPVRSYPNFLSIETGVRIKF